MEQRPSDSQNESANELPQSVPQTSLPPVDGGQPIAVKETKEIDTSAKVTNDQATNGSDSIINERVTNERAEEMSSPAEQDQSGPVDPSALERPRQERPGHERPRDNQPGQSPKQGQTGQERPGQDRQRDPNQPRQQGNQSGQDRPGQDRQPRDPNQPQKQNQPGQERTGNDRSGQPRQPNGQRPEKSVNERSGQDRQPRDPNQSQKQNQPGHERPGNDRPGNERPGRSNQPPRDARPNRETEFDEGNDEDRQPTLRQPDRLSTGPREETIRESDDRLMIGITLGDYNGIGPEVILKALQYNRLQKICTPVIYGSMRVLNRYRNLLELKDWNLNGIQQVEQASHKLTNVITCWADHDQEIQPGKVTTEAGQAAFACLQRAVEDLREGKLDAIVTAPINKHNIQSEEFTFPGHTEYLAEAFSVGDNLMFLVSDRLRVGVVTGHVPLGRVRQNITRERILQKWTMMNQSLRLDFGIDKPRIAVLGLNPHAGEEGLLGNEEQEIVKPLLKQLQDKGNLVYGPFPADGFFGTRAYLKFDAVLAMYHDQGLIPFKAIAFEEGVNFTAGMPVVRTSPDHGTAYDIAGKGIADETSMLQAIYTACDVARRRRETAEIMAGALKPKRERAA